MKTPASQSVWRPFQPTKSMPWNVRRVVHLFRRAGFGATWQLVQRSLRAGYQPTLQALLSGTVTRSLAPSKSNDRFEQTARLFVDSAIAAGHEGKLKSAWIYRMLNSPDPLAEQIALMWHNHFATSYVKVQDVRLMWKQNQLFRRHGRQPFLVLLDAILQDAAMLKWLDAENNTKRSPNENLARELMELFTLGIGNYSESDVKEAARALTGRTLRDDLWVDNAEEHDDGPKRIMGKRDRFTPSSLARLLVGHEATARRLAWRISGHFLGEDIASPREIQSLADGLQQRHLDVGWAVQTVLSSERFFSNETMGQRISPPAAYVVAAVRGLDPFQRRASTAILADWMAELGQDLFRPPNVGGWPGGRCWLSPQRMIARIRFAEALTDGRLVSPSSPRPLDLENGENTRFEKSLSQLSQLWLGRRLNDRGWRELLTTRATRPGSQVSALLVMPEAQVD